MLKRKEIVLVLELLCFLLVSSVTAVWGQVGKTITHQVKVFQPAISTTDSIEIALVQFKDRNNYRYYIDVESVSCGDNQCNVVPVRMYFNELGKFIRLEILNQQHLEKTNGKRFKSSDYQKLSAILNDRGSELARFDKDQLVAKQFDLDEVDAVTSATTPLLSEISYVKGAVWTSYTLWHWANGKLSQKIRDISGNALSAKQILSFLDNEKEEYQIFALEQITRMHNYNSVLVNKVIIMAGNCSLTEQNMILRYLENASVKTYYSALQKILPVVSKEMRIKCLRSLQNSANIAPDGYFVQLSKLVAELESYQEIDLLLSLLEKHDVCNPDVLNNIFYLLNNERVLVARRAYWFLVEKDLNKVQRCELDTFARKYAEYF